MRLGLCDTSGATDVLQRNRPCGTALVTWGVPLDYLWSACILAVGK